MTVLDFSRQSEMLDPHDANGSITVVGAGSTGSAIGFCLVKLGARKLCIYDDDTVAIENIRSTTYDLSLIGMNKAKAAEHVLRQHADTDVTGIPTKFNASLLEGVVICAVDSMDARIKLWTRMKSASAATLYIDTRIGRTIGYLFCVRPNSRVDASRYEAFLHLTDDTIPLSCGQQRIICTAMMTGALVASVMQKWWTGQKIPGMIAFDTDAIQLHSTV